MNWRQATFGAIWVIALIAKLVLSGVLPLANDESYYWVWSHHLQLSYFDHPAAVSWLFWLGQPFEGLATLGLPGAVRWPALLVGHLTLLTIKAVIGDRLTAQQHRQWLLVVLLSPFFGVGSLVVTPDLPHVATWALALLAFKNFLEAPTSKQGLALGAALGLGACAKYHIVIFVPIALAYLLANRRREAFRPVTIASVIVAGLVISSPVWLWNAMNEWVSFRFQLGHGLAQEGKSFEQIAMQFGDYFGAQLALLSPLVLFTLHRRGEPRSIDFLRWFGWGPVLFFLFTSLRSPVEANWPIAGHLPLLILATVNDSKRWLSRGMMAVWFSASLVVFAQALSPATPLFGVAPERLKTYEFVRFQSLHELAKREPNLFASSYQMAGDLSFASKRVISKLTGINRKDVFDFGTWGLPQTPRFVVAFERPWSAAHLWPQWIQEQRYREVQRTTVGEFDVVTFLKVE